MRGYTGAEIIRVDGYWKDGEGIVLSAAHAAGLTLRLRHLLFAWHEASWYGADIEERIDERSKATELPLAPLLAMDYLSAPDPVRLLRVEWTERARKLMELAGLLRRMLIGGWFAPDWSRWSTETRAWKPEIPASEPEAAAELQRLAAELEEQGDKGAARRWLSVVVEELIAADGGVAAGWRQTAEAAGEAALFMKAADEDDWLVSIGLKRDNVPFRTALQLLEPAGEEGWRLRPALQDRAEGGRWVTLPRLNEVGTEAGWSFASAMSPKPGGFPDGDGELYGRAEQEVGFEEGRGQGTDGAARLAGDGERRLRFAFPAEAPPEWRVYFAERMRKEEAKWAAALPDWIETEPGVRIAGLEGDSRRAAPFLARGAEGEDGTADTNAAATAHISGDATANSVGAGTADAARAEADAAVSVTAPPQADNAAANGMIKTELSDGEAWSFLEEASARLLAAGCSVLLPGWWEQVRSRKLRLKAKVKSSVGSSEQSMFGLQQIVDFDWKLAVGNVDLSEAEFMRLAQENRRLMQIGGEWVHLDPDDVERLRKWLRKTGGKREFTMRDVLEMHLRGGTELEPEREDAEALEAEVELNEHLAAWIGRLNESADLPLVDKPDAFHGELRPYQLQGVSWLAFLRRFGLGACLADDMGLGKTIQFTAYLQHVMEHGGLGPSLLICPTSVIGNWEKELERFAPALRLHVHYGPRRLRGAEFAAAAEGSDLVVTSYALAPIDEEELASVGWDVVCLDEAQNIKNYYTKQSTAIRGLPANHRIALTGTPMENRLTELWSIYDFTNPGYLGSLGEFRRAVVLPIERERDGTLIAELQRWVKPFMLRRLKKDPAIQLALPEKNEMQTYLSLTVEQGTLYENIVSDLLGKLEKVGAMERRGLILSALTRLKQVCDHPSLLLKEDASLSASAWHPERSNKVLRLLEMAEEIAAEGERCLIFTQYVEMGATLKRLLEEKLSLPTPYLYGGVPKASRDAMIAEFQNESTPGCAFVLSLKAGGIGLNLTAANHVIHFDRWWNPAVENQATDRAFRIGQTRNVQVHKYVTLGTLEERIDDMISRKQLLNDQVVGQSENWITELSTEELRDLFSLRKQRLKG